MSREHTAIEDAAAAWLGRRDGGLTAAQEAELAQWLRADPHNMEAFARLDAAWRVLDRLAALRPTGNAEPDADLPLRRSHGKLVWLPVTLATAAALVVAYVGWWRPAHEAVSFSWTAATEVGGLQKMALPDGSVVALNTDSAVEVGFTAAERRVRLARGEAHFVVAKNPARPFVVEASGVEVRAVGTAFNVRLRPESIEVLVTEGRVRVNDIRGTGTSLITPAGSGPASSAELPVIVAGQRAVIPLAPLANAVALAPMVVVPVAPAEISQMLAWEDRRLEFDPKPLSALVAEFNRYSRHKLVVADPAIAGLKVGGSFRVSDYDAFVRLLESSFGVTAERLENETVLRGRR